MPRADALALSKKAPGLVGQGLSGPEPAGRADLSAVAGAPLAVPGLHQDGPVPGEAFLGTPAGAALPTSAVPLSGEASAGARIALAPVPGCCCPPTKGAAVALHPVAPLLHRRGLIPGLWICAGMLLTHSSGIVGAIPEAHTQLAAAESAHLIAPALGAAGRQQLYDASFVAMT